MLRLFGVRVQDAVHDCVGRFVLGAPHVGNVAVREAPQQLFGLRVQRDEVRLFDAICARELPHDELAVEPDVDLVDAEPERAFETGDQPRPLGDVVRRDPKIRADLAERLALLVQKDRAIRGRTRIPACASVSVERRLHEACLRSAAQSLRHPGNQVDFFSVLDLQQEEFAMPPQAVFGISVVFSFAAWGVVFARFIWPELRSRGRSGALAPILMVHGFRFVGLAFIVPGVVSPNLPLAFARPAAYGDLVAAVLALLALAALQSGVGILLVWVFNIWGTADLLNAFYQAGRSGLVAGDFGAAYFIVVLFVPLLLITHGLAFRLLLRNERA
jgi:hypothetical protein